MNEISQFFISLEVIQYIEFHFILIYLSLLIINSTTPYNVYMLFAPTQDSDLIYETNLILPLMKLATTVFPFCNASSYAVRSVK